jgi:hypothetical protein
MNDKTIEDNSGSDLKLSAGRKPYGTPQLIPLGTDLVQAGTGSGCDAGHCEGS